MAFFKFRKDGDEHTNSPSASGAAPESVEAMRKRAKHRLIGAAVLVLVGVVGFPMLFDNQPRPIPVDLPINIPDKNTVKPLGNLPVGNAAPAMIEETAEPAAAPASSAVTKSAKPALAPTTPSVVAAPAASRAASGAMATQTASAAPVNKPPVKPVEKAAEKAVEKPAEKLAVAKAEAPKPTPAKPEVAKPEVVKPDPAKADGSKAQSLLEGKETFIPATSGSTPPAVTGATAAVRFVVQVGAFSDATKAREARSKLEAAGLKTYTQVVETKDGKRIRVRLGPFDTKAEIDKVAAKVKKLDLPAAILEL